MLMVVPRDIDASANPNVIKLGDVIQEARYGMRPARVPRYSAVQPNTHHLGRVDAFRIKIIKGISQVAVKLLARVKALRCGKAHVIDVKGVRNDQVRFTLSVFH